MTFTVNIKSNLNAFQKLVSAAAYKQIPFATAMALTAIAQQVVQDEQANEAKVLDRPKPFTQGALGVIRARKESMAATVFMKDITAAYLEPYQFGGMNRLNSRALLKPIEAVANLDAYGNLPRNFLRSIKGRKDIFVGTIQTKAGPVDGVWQRSTEAGSKVQIGQAKVGKDGKLRIRTTAKGGQSSGHLKLLVKFSDAHAAKQFLDWFGVARRTVDQTFNREMGKALAKALATAR